ncbi:MAG: LD-carboxypeptidase [Anaerolineaceae bacterium]|nr:LD-carboxypeptidase [Anaerolineaceae bacterium]
MIPEKLTVGDTIGIIAPSDPVRPDQGEHLQAGIDLLTEMGFKVRLGQNIYSQTLDYTAAPAEKVSDLHQMFADPTIKAIICAQGGDTANTFLRLIDWDLIRSNPKIIMGISDITVLLNAVWKQTGLVTFHGNDLLWGFGDNPTQYDKTEFTRVLVGGLPGPIPANSPRKAIRSGVATGRLIGGNLRCLLKLAGTSYWPDFTDAILFIEAMFISPKRCYASFQQLEQIGVFKGIQGAVVGYIDGMQRDGGTGPFMEDILLEATQDYTFPILKINDFGHNCPNTILPIGAQASLNADLQSLEILEKCVL